MSWAELAKVSGVPANYTRRSQWRGYCIVARTTNCCPSPPISRHLQTCADAPLMYGMTNFFGFLSHIALVLQGIDHQPSQASNEAVLKCILSEWLFVILQRLVGTLSHRRQLIIVLRSLPTSSDTPPTGSVSTHIASSSKQLSIALLIPRIRSLPPRASNAGVPLHPPRAMAPLSSRIENFDRQRNTV